MNLKFYKEITIVIVSYKSREKVIHFAKKIPKKFKVIIIDNSKDLSLKKKLELFKNIKVFLRENNGVSSAINFAVKKINTKYFFQISPDLEFNFNKLIFFYNEAIKMNNKFSAIGPRYINVNKKSHKQSNINKRVGYVEAIHGSAMFINKQNFNNIGGFDENFFLYFEENEFCKRGKKNGFYAYQLNDIEIKKLGETVEFNNNKKKQALSNLLSWHFVWSKYYFYKKYNGKIFSIIYFQPLLIRSILKFIFYYFFKNQNEFEKYKFRIKGLWTSITNKKSYLRINDIL